MNNTTPAGEWKTSCQTNFVLLLLRIVVRHARAVVYAKHGDGRLSGELDALGLGHGRLEHARLEVVTHFAGNQVQPGVLHVLLRWVCLRGVVEGAQLGDELDQMYRRQVVDPGPYGWSHPMEIRTFAGKYGRRWASGGLRDEVRQAERELRQEI